MKFSQMTQRVGNRFKQRLAPFFNGVYSTYAKLRKAVGNPIVINDASDEALQGLRVFGKSTQDQIEAYKALHTNKPNTTIYNDQNAWMEVEYIKS